MRKRRHQRRQVAKIVGGVSSDEKSEHFGARFVLLSFALLFFALLLRESGAQECFEQQYSNAVADLRSPHVIQRLAVVAPLGAFYVQPPSEFSEPTIGAHEDGAHFFQSADARNFLRKEDGEPVVVYASSSSTHLEWQTLNLLTSALKVVAAYEADETPAQQQQQHAISPIVVITACPYRTRPVYLDGQPFSVSSSTAGLVSMYENELVVNFRTFEDGIFFFSMADQGDLLVAQIYAGRVETFFDFGALSRSVLSGGRALNDGEWHELRWTHQFDSVQLFVDKVLVNSTTPSGLYRKLDFNHQIEIGGRAEDQYSSEIQTIYHGCLARILLNNVDLLQFAPKNAKDCQMPQPQMMSICGGASVQIAYSFLPFNIEFRLPYRDTTLLTVMDVSNETLLEVHVDENRYLLLEAENGQIRQSSLPAVTVNDGSWHALSLKLRGGRLDVELDTLTVLWLEGALVRKIGMRMSVFQISAVGCYRSTTVDLRSSVPPQLQLSSAANDNAHNGQVVKDKCLFREKCVPNPCRNGGTCIQTDLDAFRCNCTKHYAGTFCHTSLLPRSCEDYRIRRRHQRYSSTASSLTSSLSEISNASALIKSLQQFGLSQQHYAADQSHYYDIGADNSGKHYGNGGDGESSDGVIVDLDGGGPLRPFLVFCTTTNSTGKAGKRRKPDAAVAESALNGGSTTPHVLADNNKRYGVITDSSGASESSEHNNFGVPEADDEHPLEHFAQDTNNVEEEEGEVTLLKSDMPATGIMVADGPTEPGAIRRTLDYGVEGAELDRFVDGFHYCRQFMRFECRGGTRLMSYGTERRPSSWYATRGGQHGLQWADAPPYSRMCACALNATCDANKMCNCDSGRDAVDEGYSNFQQLLPILQLFIGGTTASHKSSANAFIGPLRCSRRKVFGAVTFTNRNAQLVVSQNFNAPIFDFYAQLRFSYEHMTVFTWESANGQRWFQLLVRNGRLVGQLVNAGHSSEIVSDVTASDNLWHSVYWEVDRYSMRLVVDRNEKSISSFFLLPAALTFILGSRTGRGNSGYAGQVRNLYLASEELVLTQLVQKMNPMGVRVGELGFCDSASRLLRQSESGAAQKRCENDGVCVEMYDRYRCNCTNTPFTGEKCTQEVGMWVPLGSHVSIPWQHPSQAASNCHGISVYTASVNVSLIRARALFAESSFNLSINEDGHLNVEMYDGFFFMHNVTFHKFAMNDSKLKDVKFCATKNEFKLTVNEELALALEGNFTFFQNFNAWNFIHKNFMGCVSRLKIGSGFPLKNPTLSRLSHSPGIKLGSCPFDALEYHKNDAAMKFSNDEDESDALTSANSDIQITAIMKNQQRLLLITPAIGLLTAAILALALCIFVCYVRSRPDGVYKTNENLISGYAASASSAASCGQMTVSSHSALSKSSNPLMSSSLASAQQHFAKNGNNGITSANGKTYLQRPFPNTNQTALFTKEYFC